MALKTCLKSIKEQQQGSRAQNGTGFPHVARLGVARGVRPAAASCAVHRGTTRERRGASRLARPSCGLWRPDLGAQTAA